MTLGEYRVGINFNPSNSGDVAELKTLAAQFIDAVERVRVGANARTLDPEHFGEVSRLCALAITHAEDAAMWAVKAATKPPRE